MPPKKEESAEKATAPATSGSSDSKIIGALAYILGLLAILLFLVKKDDKFVRFHSLQAVAYSLAVGGIVVAIYIVIFVLAAFTGGIGGVLIICLFPLAGLGLLYQLYCAYMAFQGNMYKIPVIGDFVIKYA